MSNDIQTTIEVRFTGLMAIHRPTRGGIGVSIHKTAPHHLLMITLSEVGEIRTRANVPLFVADRTMTEDIYLTIDGRPPKRDLAFDAYGMTVAVLDGQGFHNRKLFAKPGILTPCFYIDDAQFSAIPMPVHLVRGQSREPKDLALEVSAKIILEGDEKATLTYGEQSYSFPNDGRFHQFCVTNLEDLWHINSHESDFQYYYYAFPEIDPEDRYNVVNEKIEQTRQTEPGKKTQSSKEATYQRPCIPIFLENSSPD